MAKAHSKRRKVDKQKGIKYRLREFIKSSTPYTSWAEWDFRPDLHKEEVRGLFVLGIIAALLAARSFLDFKIDFEVVQFTIQSLLSFMIVGWGAYAFLMALGVSQDWIGKPLAKMCYALAWLSFIMGIGVSLGMIFVLATFRVFFSGLHVFLPTAPAAIVSLCFSAAVYGIVAAILGITFGARWPPFLYYTPNAANHDKQAS